MIIMDPPHLDGYEWGARIGGGSFSSVYKGVVKNAEKTPVAIKCISRRSGKKINNDAAVKEIALMKNLKHINIVKLHDFQFDSKNIYIIMEFCTEGDLAMFLKKKYKFAESFLQILMQQLAAALRYLRGKNICHMDLKPQNILLTRTPELILKIGDFGLSRILCDENIEQSRFAGSFRYMAPEKILNQKYDSRIDLWSVGIIMYECLVGRTPFASTTLKGIVDTMAQQRPIEVPSCISLSTTCENLLSELLKYNPAERIGFDDFFNHEFLQLNYLPSPENYERVKTVVNEGTALEKSKKFPEALAKCEEAICYLEGFSCTETNSDQKKIVSDKITEYKRWRGQLTYLIEQSSSSGSKSTVVTSESQYQALYNLCKATPNIKNALDIGRVAEMYVLDGKTSIALDKITAALDILIPLINTEPAGIRKDMLHKQIQQWLRLGETLKKSL